MSALLEASRLRHVRGTRAVLEDVSLALEAGRMVGVIGPNGAGKTTLLRVLAGLETPAAGEVRCRGRPLASLAARARARDIGYHAQVPELHWPMPVASVVALGRLPYARGLAHLSDDDRAAVARAVTRTGLEMLLARRSDTLSGGELARVHLARLLAGEHRVLLADEPIANLDPHFQFETLDLLRAHCAAGGAVLTVLHDLAIAARYCDRVVLMTAGRVVAAGPARAVLTRDAVARVFGVGRDYFELSGLAAALAGDHG